MQSDNNVDIFFLGDTYFGEWHMRLRGRKGQSNILEEKGYLHFGQNFEEILSDGDEVLMNLECSITDIEPSPLIGTEKKHLYSAREEGTISAFKKLNITTCMLANNHAVDYGKAGLMDTIMALENAGIKYIGGGRTEAEAAKPLIFEKSIDGKIFRAAIVSCYNYGVASDNYGFYAKNNIPGVNKKSLKSVTNQIEVLKKIDKDLMYILSPHWGPNYVWRTFTQQQQGEEFIRAGTDLIVGHSAHMIQEIEYYKNKLIMYSIGNFLINGNGEYKRRKLPPYSFIARLNVQNIDDVLVKKMIVYPILVDNLATDFTPRFVNEKEFIHVKDIIRSHDITTDVFDDKVKIGEDKYGKYFEYFV
ncbi:MAG: CapA family protein [Sulfurimonas sp.]|nr:CapA family protein [Sulfurimonas sp.]MDQ7059917.1 CapA family protein [Sulfurimonas sp.]